MSRLLLVLLVLICSQTSRSFAQTTSNPTATLPSNTDPQISAFNDANYSWLPSAHPRNELLLFLQGTNGMPRPQFPFLDMASALGYHVIELSYPNSLASQQACIGSSDPSAYIKFRLEIIQGGNLSDLIEVSSADSIDSRLKHLLQYLDFHQGGQGWGHFLNKDGQINWSNIAVAGQSQGGGHAYVISKYHQVARVIMTGSPKDYSHYFNKPAGGFDADTKTPLNRYFTFNHVSDGIAGCNHIQQMEILQQMGLTRFGVADVEHSSPNYNHARILLLSCPLGNNPKQYHGAPLNPSIPCCPYVWRYMLTEAVQ